MPLRWSLRPNTYHDSIKLMRVSEALAALPGVSKAAVVMATPLNLDLLKDDGLLPPGIQATADDLVISLSADEPAAADAALARIDELLRSPEQPTTNNQQPITNPRPRTLETATSSNLAVIAVPGPLAAAEAYAALRAGLHVFLFSNNVPLAGEVQLKKLAAEAGLLMMGPDCGTAIIDGVGLGFANRVTRGPVGIVGASGTGIQQLCCLLDAAGIGVAQAIGTGGRDLSPRVGGSMTRRALERLDADPEVHIIAVVSKVSGAAVARRLHAQLEWLSKPAIACLLGAAPPGEGHTRYAKTLTEAAVLIEETLGIGRKSQVTRLKTQDSRLKTRNEQRIYGLYTGGTLCNEAVQILDEVEAPHQLVDLGADQYTRGRAHPIIDPRLRASMLAELAQRDDVGAVLLDVILGDMAHPDPAGALLPALSALPSGTPVFAVLIGTRQDPQGLEHQRETLEAAGAQVFISNAEAAVAAASIP